MQKTCKNCSNEFEIREADENFYKIMEVTRPTLCYLCRMQRRLSYRNERFLYNRQSSLSGKNIISTFSEDKPFPVYGIDEWWEDSSDATIYGRDFDFKKPFFEQFFDLRNKVPRLALQQQKPMINSEYCNCASQNKNCYLVFSTNRCEDCYYGSWVNDSKDCIDNLNIYYCELCYDCTNLRECYDLKYCYDCINCKSSYFLRDCAGCMNCFACSNLHNKTYCIFNKQKTKKEYEAFMKSVELGSYKVVNDGKEKAQKILHDLIVKEFHGVNTQNCLGDYLRNCKDAYMCFECDNSESIAYSMCVNGDKDSMDHSYWGTNCERMYECQACGYDLFNLRFCNLCWTSCSDLTYCDHCFSCKNCFGCVGLKKQEYCVFNKQYKKEAYKKIVERIVNHMKGTGEWGEFFPIKDSTYTYNESLANEQIPLTESAVLAKGWMWQQPDAKEYMPQNYDIKDNIKDTDDDIINKLLKCIDCGKNYKIILPELNFYKKRQIPIPRKCPNCRHKDRMHYKNFRIMYGRNCAKCQKPIKTTYQKTSQEIVYCEKCYLEAVY